MDQAFTADVFLYDRVTGTTVLVSHVPGDPATAANQESVLEAFSADGNWIVFYSRSSDLVEGLENDPAVIQLYLFERATGRVTLISRRATDGGAGHGSSSGSTISAEGSVVAFSSEANDLTDEPLDPSANVFLFERAPGAVTLVSHSASSPNQEGNGGLSFYPVLSADGRFVAYFSRATDLVTGQVDPNSNVDLFLYDRTTGANTLVNHANTSALRVSNDRPDANLVSISADSRFLVYASSATDLVAGVTDTNRRPDVFLYDRLTNSSSLVGRSAESPNVTGPLGSRFAIISADGSTVAFVEATRNFQRAQAFLFDRSTGRSTLVTRSAASPSSPSSSGTVALDLSADGRYLLLASLATDLVPGQVDIPDTPDVFLYDRAAGTMALVSHAAGSPVRTGDAESTYHPGLSADGSLAVYASAAGDIDTTKRDSNQTYDTFIYERAAATSRVISLHPPGVISRTANSASFSPTVSGDGRYVVYLSLATNLVPGQVDRNHGFDIFLYDRIGRKTFLVSRSASSPRVTGNATSEAALISRDGSTVLFSSKATDLVAGQFGPVDYVQVFLFNRLTGKTVLVSRTSASPARAGNGNSYAGGLSVDGAIAAFSSVATDLIAGRGDRNRSSNVFLYDLGTSTTTLVSHNSRSPFVTGAGSSWFSSMSLEGESIAFTSTARDLNSGVPPRPSLDGQPYPNAYLFQRQTGSIALISPDGPPWGGINPLLSADGRYVAYFGDGIRLLDRTTGRSIIVERDRDSFIELLGLSEDGRWVLFNSYDNSVVPGQSDANDQPDLFLFDAVRRTTRLVSHVPGLPNTTGRYGAGGGRVSADGRWVVFVSSSPEFLSEPTGPGEPGNVFRFDVVSGEVELVSHTKSSPEQAGHGASGDPSVSAAGGVIAFISYAQDLVPADFNLDVPDIFEFVPEPEE